MVKHREVTNEWTLPEKSTVLAPLQAALISQKSIFQLQHYHIKNSLNLIFSLISQGAANSQERLVVARVR